MTGRRTARAMTPEDADAAARLFAAASGEGAGSGWDAAAVRATLAAGGFGAIAQSAAETVGAALARPAGDDAEILNVAVRPADRGAGFGRALVEAVATAAAAAGAARLVLEAAADNAPALALYRGRGFERIGVRKAYYKRPDGAIDAEIMALGLNRPRQAS